MGYEIERGRQERQDYAAVRATANMRGIPGVIDELMTELGSWLRRRELTPPGAPWVRYLAVGPEELELELGVPVPPGHSGDGRVMIGTMPLLDRVATIHRGPYDRLPEAYRALDAWMAGEGLQPSGAMWEVYLTDPSAEPDPERWETLVCVPVSRP